MAESKIGKRAAVTKICDGLGYSENDHKYIGRTHNQVVKLVAEVPDSIDFYITDFFILEYIKENNDYIHYGFLKVSKDNITFLSEGEY